MARSSLNLKILLFYLFFFNIFVSTLSPRIHLLLQCWFFSSFASPSLFLYIFFFVITTAFNYVYKYVYSKKTAELVRFATFKSLFERKSLEKKKRKKKKKFIETVKSPRNSSNYCKINDNLSNYLN